MAVISTNGLSPDWDAAALQSEMQRQQDEARLIWEAANFSFITVAGVVYPNLQTALNAATAEHYRRLLAAAQAAGLESACWLGALKSLGAC